VSLVRSTLVLVVLGAAAPVAAQPTPAPPAPVCRVEMVRVPDDVRPVIEDWVRAEPRCAVQLAVRVIPTDGGLYVLATDGSGRVRDRVVPDATTAAVLIASWVADDGASPTTSPTAPPDSPAPPPLSEAPGAPGGPVTPTWAMKSTPVTPAWAMKSPPVTPTWAMKTPPVTPTWGEPRGISAPGSIEPADIGASASGSAQGGWRLASATIVVHPDGAGLRGEVDLFRWWRVDLGVLAAWTHTASYAKYRDLALDDITLAFQAAHERRWGRFNARAALAAGLTITSGTHMEGTHAQESMVTPVADGAITAGFRLTGRIELRAGVALTALPQKINNGQWFWYRDFVPQIVFGLGYRGD